MFLANGDNKKQLRQLLLRVSSGQQADSKLWRTEAALLILEGKAYHFVSSKDEEAVLLLLLRKYTIIIINQVDFTLSVITSAFKHQWPFVFHVEVLELPTVFNSDTRTQISS